jgi:hypothetical protein
MAEKRRPAKKRKMTKAEQAERFKRTAREVEADESGQTFDEAFKKIVPEKRRPK